MNNPIIQTDIADILKKLDQKLDNLENKFEQKLDKIDERLNKIQINQAEIKGDIKTLDTKVEQLDKRISNSEFTNRGVLIGLIVVILGGAAKFFGIVNNP